MSEIYHAILSHGHTVFVGWEPSLANLEEDEISLIFSKPTHKPIIMTVKYSGKDPLRHAKRELSPLHVIYDMREMDTHITMWCQRYKLGVIHRDGFTRLEMTPNLSFWQRPGSDRVESVQVVGWTGSPCKGKGIE